MATYKGIGYDSTAGKNRTGATGDEIEFTPSTLTKPDASGTNTVGTALAVQSGASTGSANGGDINFQVSAGAASGTAVRAQSTVLAIAFDGIAVTGDATVSGDLSVTGDIISRGSVNLVIQDPYIDLGVGNTSNTANSCGFSFTMQRGTLAAEVITTVTVGDGGAFATLTSTTSPTGFAANDVLVLSGTSSDGIYVVNSIAGTTINLKGQNSTTVSGSLPFAQTNTDAAQSGLTASAIKPDLKILGIADGTANFNDAGGVAYAEGVLLEVFAANAVESDFTGNGDYTPVGESASATTLQQAYDAGASITTDASGDILFTLSADAQGFSVEGSGAGNGDVSIGGATAISSYSINASGAANTINSTGQALTVKTTTSGALALTSAGTNTMTSASGSALTLNDGVATFVMTSGSITESALVNTTLTGSGTMTLTGGGVSKFGDDTGTWDFDGAGNLTETGMVAVTITPSDAMTLTAGAASTWSTGAGALTITSAAACTWSTAAGVLTIDGKAGLDLDSDGTNPVNLGTEAVAKTVTIGNAASTKVQIDAIVVDINGAGTGVTIDALDAGSIDIGTSAVAASDTSAVNIGTSATARTITIGNDASTKVDVNALAIELDSAGTVSLNSVTTTEVVAGGNIDMITTGGNVDISTDAVTNNVSITSNFVNLMRVMTADGTGYAAGDCLYGVNSGGNLVVGKANASLAATSQFIGIGLTTKGAGATGKVIFGGIVRTVTADINFVAATHLGKPVYLSTTAGQISPTPPSASANVIYQVGLCVGSSADRVWEVLLQPRFVMEIG